LPRREERALKRRAREREFASLSDDEATRAEAIYEKRFRVD
jgi:hypothetical protein